MGKLAVNQSSDSSNPCRVLLTMMAISLKKGLVTTHPTNGVFNYNPPFGKGGVVGYIIRGTGLSTWFAAGRCAGAERVDTHISQIADAADAIRQTPHQRRLLQQRDVGGWPSYTLGDIHHLARVLIPSHLAFERVGLFLARIHAIGLLALTRTLDALLKAVNNHHQFGRVPQQFIQLAAAFAPRIGQAHRVSTGLFQDWQHALKGAPRCCIAYSKQIT